MRVLNFYRGVAAMQPGGPVDRGGSGQALSRCGVRSTRDYLMEIARAARSAARCNYHGEAA